MQKYSWNIEKIFKGYSVGSAALATFLLFRAFIDEINFLSPVKKIDVIDLT